MDTQELIQVLRDEITEIEALIEKWQPALDKETRWAISMIELSLIHKRRLLSEALESG